MVPGIVHLWGNSLLDYHVKISTPVDGFLFGSTEACQISLNYMTADIMGIKLRRTMPLAEGCRK